MKTQKPKIPKMANDSLFVYFDASDKEIEQFIVNDIFPVQNYKENYIGYKNFLLENFIFFCPDVYSWEFGGKKNCSVCKVHRPVYSSKGVRIKICTICQNKKYPVSMMLLENKCISCKDNKSWMRALGYYREKVIESFVDFMYEDEDECFKF